MSAESWIAGLTGRNDLVYFFVRDEQYVRMLELLIPSLRSHGQYAGDIIIFAEHLTQRIANLREYRVRLMSMSWAHFFPWALDRPLAMDSVEVDWQSYRTITLMDSDILCRGDINPILDRCAASRRILHQEETWQVYGKLNPGHHQEMYIWAMSQRERELVAQMHPINAGVLSWPSHLHDPLRKAWAKSIASAPDGWAKDQATLNKVLRFDLMDYCALYDPHDIGNATMLPREQWAPYKLLHFAGNSRRMPIMEELAKTDPSP